MTGTRILHYQLGERLGGGGMGEVFRAEDTRLGRVVALKFLSPQNRSDPEKRRRLLQEARAASSLRSPYIAVIYDVIEQGEDLFIVMEYVEGKPLSEKLEAGPLPVVEALSYSLQAAEALVEAHAHGVVHRDIKASNLMVTPRGLVKVLDFGIAKVVAPGNGEARAADTTAVASQLTSPGIILGTVSYMSPEQALAKPLDARSDIFSLGIVMYQMCTGKLPFEGESVTHIIDRILHHEPTPAGLLNAEVPAQLSLLIQHAMEKDLDHRCPSAVHLVRGLRKMAGTTGGFDFHGIAAETDDIDGPPRRPGAETLPENAVAILTFANITREPADEWIGTGIAETVTADLQNVPGLNVIQRARIYEVLKTMSSSAIREPDDRVAMDLGRRLGATWLVRGAYQRMGEVIRITAHLGEVRTGKLLKTVKVDGPLSDIFRLQDSIVYALTPELNLKLGGAEVAQIEKKETHSVEAYEAYSRGLLNLRTADRDSLDRAIQLFEKAVRIDPRYASAWAALSSACSLKGSFLGFQDLLERAVEHARRALSLDPRLPLAHIWLGTAFAALGKFDDALRSIEEGVRLDPSNSMALSMLGRVHWVGFGRIQEGIAALERCVELNPEFGHVFLQLSFLHAIERNLGAAEAAARKAIELQGKALSGSEGLRVIGGHSRLGYALYLRGAYTDAVREYETEIEQLATSDHALRERTLIELHQKLGAATLRLGDRESSSKHLDHALKSYYARIERGSEDPFTAYYAACAHALRGDTDRALARLADSSRRLGALNRKRVAADPDLESLRGDPRLEAALGGVAPRMPA
jgi:tetratricopeptide (TPR) repeat protein/predicted Ser/Thr protein kinase